jgi:hypothetical protein
MSHIQFQILDHFSLTGKITNHRLPVLLLCQSGKPVDGYG